MPPPMQAPSYAPDLQAQPPPMRQSGEQERLIVQEQIEKAKPSMRKGEFPGGWIDKSGQLHRAVEVREIRGHEEEIISNDSIDNITKADMIFANCIQRVGSITDRGQIAELVPDLLVGDRIWLLIEIRRASVGDVYPFLEVCPACEEEQSFTLNLGDLKVQSLADPMTRVYPVQLPSGRVAELCIPTGRQERFRDGIKDTDPAQLSKIMLSRLALLDGRPALLNDVLDLSLADRTELTMAVDDLPECGVDLTIETTCPNARQLVREFDDVGLKQKYYIPQPCGYERTRQMTINQPGFFYPAQVLKRWKKKLLSSRRPSDIPLKTV